MNYQLNEIKMLLSEIKRIVDRDMKFSPLYYQLDEVWIKFMVLYDKIINFDVDLVEKLEEQINDIAFDAKTEIELFETEIEKLNQQIYLQKDEIELLYKKLEAIESNDKNLIEKK